MTFHKCHHCGERSGGIERVDEAGADLCRHCREEFWTGFFRAEARAEGDR
jgi:formylmethanofuran dehydrogenase subunit E